MKLIFKETSYDEARISTNLLMLKNRKEQLCKSLFGKMQNPEHKFHCLLSETSSYTHGFTISIRIKYLKLELKDVRAVFCTMDFSITNNHF